jgi:hypothetical protein
MGKTTITLGSKVITLHYEDFDTDINVDDFTKIHYENIVGEIATMPVLMNRIGLLKAQVDNRLSEEKLENQIHEAGLRKLFKSEMLTKGQKYNLQDVDDAVETDAAWINRKRKIIRFENDCKVIESIYWALKSKDDKLNNIKNNLTPKEFENEIIEGTINGIMIKKNKPLSREV